MAEKPAQSPQNAKRGQGELRVPKHGRGKLRTGGTNKGGTGRPPKTFAAFMKSLREKAEVHDAIERAAEDETSRGFAPVLKTMTDYDTEKPAQRIVVDADKIKQMTTAELEALLKQKK